MWACLVLLKFGWLTPRLCRHLHPLGICNLEPSPEGGCPQLLSKTVNRVYFLVLNSPSGRHGDTCFTGEWCNQNSCLEVSFSFWHEEMKMFISSLCKSSFSRRDGAWRLKPDSQEQVKDLKREPVSLAAPAGKWSRGGKALSLFVSLLFFHDCCQQCHKCAERHGRVKPEVCLLLVMAGRSF